MKKFGKLRPVNYVPGRPLRKRFGKLKPIGRVNLGHKGEGRDKDR